MHVTDFPEGNLSSVLKTAAPAVIMPLLFTVISAWITADAELLRQSWSVIAPSSLFGALAVVYVPALQRRVSALLTRLPKVVVGLLGGAGMATAVLALGFAATLITPMSTDLLKNIAMSAGAGAFATILSVFPSGKRISQRKG